MKENRLWFPISTNIEAPPEQKYSSLKNFEARFYLQPLIRIPYRWAQLNLDITVQNLKNSTSPMPPSQQKYEIEKKGTWLYGDKSANVSIVKQNWDSFFEEGYEETPELNEAGEAYYVIWGEFQNIIYANRSRTCLSLDEALTLANDSLDQSISWD